MSAADRLTQRKTMDRSGLGVDPISGSVYSWRRESIVVRYRPDWGGWVFDAEANELLIEHYSVDLGRCRTTRDVVDWLGHVGKKSWASDEVLAGLVRALDDTLDLCGLAHAEGPVA